ncbi:hypothetical protein [Methylacidimicrobium sp. B4]|nr:hypothetical protein [Methylacidimicrobium sp. B4]QSR84935.1 hypothetical protein MacB4_01280 [Methylacidimicrobium sp. B4]
MSTRERNGQGFVSGSPIGTLGGWIGFGRLRVSAIQTFPHVQRGISC